VYHVPVCATVGANDGFAVGPLKGDGVGNADNNPDPNCTDKVFKVFTQGSLPNTSTVAVILQVDFPTHRDCTTDSEFGKLHDEDGEYAPQPPVGVPNEANTTFVNTYPAAAVNTSV